MTGYGDARLYAYSNTRVKAMESELIPRSTMDELARMEGAEPILARLLQTSYRKSIEEYGGAKIRTDLVDFALSGELARSTGKLERITPASKRDLISLFTLKFDVGNVKLMLEAKAAGRRYEDVEHHLVETGRMSKALMRELYAEPTLGAMATKMSRRLPFKGILAGAADEYARTKSIVSAENALDKGFYEVIAGAAMMKELLKSSKEAAALLRREIEMRNVLALLRCVRYGLTEQELSGMLIHGGITPVKGLVALFKRSKSVEDAVAGIRSFDLKNALKLYQQSNGTQMLRFEIAMRNSMFASALHMLRYSVLSFGTLAGYAYMKEMEVFALRTLVNARQHGLSSAETGELIAWSK